MIIVEGCDGSGKDTLIERLLHDRALQPLHLQPRMADSQRGPRDDLLKWCENDLSRPPESRDVYNRHSLVSELIYGPIIRGSNKLVDEGRTWTELMMALKQLYHTPGVLVICSPPLDIVQANVSQERDMPGVVENLTSVWIAYRQMHAMLGAAGLALAPILYDYTMDDDSDAFGYGAVRYDIMRHLWRYGGLTR